MKESDREELLEHYYSLLITFAQAEIDIRHSQSKDVEYALDYSAFYDGITQKSRPKNAMDAVSGQFYYELVSAFEIPFSPFITGATFLEVIDGFLRNIDGAKRIPSTEVVHRINNGYRQIQNIKTQPTPGNSHNLDLRQDYIEDELRIIDRLLGTSVNNEIARTLKLIGPGGPVKGLGDQHRRFISDLPLSKGEIEKKYSSLRELRWTKDNRSSEEKEFRYSVDAINIVAVEALQPLLNKSEVTYVTRSSQAGLMREGMGRTPLVPLYWLKAHKSKDLLSPAERGDFFALLSSHTKMVYNGILARPAVPKGNDLLVELVEALEPLLSRLDGVNRADDPRNDTDEHYRLTDKLYAMNVRDRQIAEAEERVLRLWRDFNSGSSDDLIERGGLERLEYYQTLTDKLRKMNDGS